MTQNFKLPLVLTDAVDFVQRAATLFLGFTHASLPSSRVTNQVVDLRPHSYSLSSCGKRRQLFCVDPPPQVPGQQE